MPQAAGLYYTLTSSDLGSRPPIVLIHGAGGNQLYWPTSIRKLERNRVFALDLPGHGKSDSAGRHAVGDYAAAVQAWLDSFPLSRAVLAGHSMGGAIALWLALQQPALVAGLILVGSGARLRVDPAILEDTRTEATFREAVARIVDRAFGPQASPGLVQLARRRMLETRHTVLHGDFLACDQFDVMDRLKEIRCPTLVICGTADRLSPVKYSQTLADEIPGARLRLIDGAGHMLMLERPLEVAQAVSDFMDRHFPRGAPLDDGRPARG